MGQAYQRVASEALNVLNQRELEKLSVDGLQEDVDKTISQTKGATVETETGDLESILAFEEQVFITFEDRLQRILDHTDGKTEIDH